MSNPWFRLYTEWDSDPKVQSMPEHMQRRLIMLFCEVGRASSGASDEERAFHWRISLEELAATKTLFIRKGFCDEAWRALNWEKRQFQSDSSKDRTKRYRDRREAAGLSRGHEAVLTPELYSRDGHMCIYCQSQDNLCIDHIYPICLGGDDDLDNLGVACKRCNSGKSGRTPEQAKYKILNAKALDRYIRYVTVTGRDVTVTVTAQNRTEQNRTEKPESSIPKPTQGNKPSDVVYVPDETLEISVWARCTAEKCGLFTMKIQDAIAKVAGTEFAAGRKPADVEAAIVGSWAKYEPLKLDAKFGAENFFKSGTWKQYAPPAKKEKWDAVDSLIAREAALDAQSDAEWNAKSAEERAAIERANRLGSLPLRWKLETKRRYPRWNAMQVEAEVQKLVAQWEAANP